MIMLSLFGKCDFLHSRRSFLAKFSSALRANRWWRSAKSLQIGHCNHFNSARRANQCYWWALMIILSSFGKCDFLQSIAGILAKFSSAILAYRGAPLSGYRSNKLFFYSQSCSFSQGSVYSWDFWKTVLGWGSLVSCILGDILPTQRQSAPTRSAFEQKKCKIFWKVVVVVFVETAGEPWASVKDRIRTFAFEFFSGGGGVGRFSNFFGRCPPHSQVAGAAPDPSHWIHQLVQA